MNDERMNESEEERRLRRRRRLEEMKREKRRAELMQRKVIPAAALAILIVAVVGISALIMGGRREKPDNSGEQSMASVGGYPERDEGYIMLTMPPEESDDEGGTALPEEPNGEGADEEIMSSEGSDKEGVGTPASQTPGIAGTETPQPKVYTAVSTSATTGFAEEVISEYGVVIDVENGTILAQRNAKTTMSPASMTKVLTVLTAADALGIGGADWASNPVLDETFEITINITDYSFVNGCSNVGFDVGEKVTVRDLFYGTILPSGADAALGLACYVAGSHEAFVELMNRKLEELGLSDSTHFTNCVGLYDENHYSTVYDIAVILKTAADNPFCRAVLSAHKYNTGATEQHPEGLLISNWFLRRIEDKDTHGEVICGKTGYVVQSKNCAASLAADVHGKEYICVTAGSSGSGPCLNDHVKLYQTWLAAE
ncbi:MAG: D-alanyl-D-alanine carboxypeptidase [Acetatifactor sp.]|nr:D-alanyl-D-alanine carboxypeptidase [Acetatifactor sp.]